MFKTHPLHIKRIKALLSVHPKVYFHGDGNMYVDANKEKFQEHPSDFAVKYGTTAAEYRTIFTSVEQVPENIDDLNKLLIEGKANEMRPKIEEKGSFISIKDEVEDEPTPQVKRVRKVN